MSRYYIDCEFDGHNGPLLTIAIVHEDGKYAYIRTDQQAFDPWVSKNVVPKFFTDDANMDFLSINRVGEGLRACIGNDPQPIIIADSPVDIGRFCDALSTGPDGQWASANYERMTFIVENVDCYPTDLPGAVQHNAWWDAMALRHKLRAHP